MNLINKIVNKENLYWAWEKLKYSYKIGDVLFDEIELSNFEANLDSHFQAIIAEIQRGEYLLTALKPIGYPKSADDEGNPRTRQMFGISVRDQLVWIATVNIVGPYLDLKMPFWSYGNRLFMSVFYEEHENGKTLEFGPYRNTSKHLYRKWTQSWPMYRKHIALTIKRIAQKELDEQEEELITLNDQIEQNTQIHNLYIKKDYWKTPSEEIFWASIDFSKFYPKAKIKVVVANILKYLPPEEVTDVFEILLNNLSAFEIDYSDWQTDELESIQLEKQNKHYHNIPTGLFVSGFLANVLLLEVDLEVQKRIINDRRIAHFRFVDDHIILSSNFDELISWIDWYTKLLADHETGVEINIDKTEPKSLNDFISSRKERVDSEKTENEELYNTAKEDCKLDPDFPSPLMTQTLNKISKINATEFDLLGESGKDAFIADIEHLLLADFEDGELRKDTRLSFAATMLSRIIPKRIFENSRLLVLECQLSKEVYEFKLKSERLKKYNKRITTKDKSDYSQKIDNLQKEIQQISRQVDKQYQTTLKRTYRFLLKVIFENYDKIRLWTRALEFCLNAGYNGIFQLLEVLDKLKTDKRASPLTLIYLKALVLQLLSHLGLKALNNLGKEKTSYLERERSLMFLKYLLDEALFENINCDTSQKHYYKNALALYNNTFSVITYLLKNDPANEKYKNRILAKKVISKRGSIASTLKKIEPGKHHLSNWIWWYNSKLVNNLYHPSLLWTHAVNSLRFHNTSDFALLSLYPKSIPIEYISNVNFTNEGLIFDWYKAQNDKEIKKTKAIETIIRKTGPLKNDVTLYDWVKWLNNHEIQLLKQYHETSSSFFDPRFSEWTALEIVRQITEKLTNKLEHISFGDTENIAHQYVHPNNYIISKSWVDNLKQFSWNSWDKIVDENKINFNHEDRFIYDIRFTPQILDPYEVQDDYQPIIQGLGSLLVCLLARNFDLPAYWNVDGHQRAWLGLIQSKLTDGHISSLTKQIIASIFSKRNRETLLLKSFFQYRYSEDTLLDPPIINDFTTLKELIEKSQSILKQYRINIQDDLPRQLIPVSLKQITQQYSPYDNEE